MEGITRSLDPIGIFTGKPSFSGGVKNMLDPFRVFIPDEKKSEPSPRAPRPAAPIGTTSASEIMINPFVGDEDNLAKKALLG